MGLSDVKTLDYFLQPHAQEAPSILSTEILKSCIEGKYDYDETQPSWQAHGLPNI